MIYQFRDGKVVRNWLETDRLGALQQIGAPVKQRLWSAATKRSVVAALLARGMNCAAGSNSGD